VLPTRSSDLIRANVPHQGAPKSGFRGDPALETSDSPTISPLARATPLEKGVESCALTIGPALALAVVHTADGGGGGPPE
jgi:hypothetical protein